MAAIDFSRSKDGKAIKVYEFFTRLSIAHTGFDPKYIWGTFVADGAAQLLHQLKRGYD